MKCNSCKTTIKKKDKVILDIEGKIQCLECAKHSKDIIFNEGNTFIFEGGNKMNFITIEQFNKASEKVQYFILDWWTPSDGDLMYNLETKEREIFEPSYMDIDCVHSQCVPLLTIGQLIELIEDRMSWKLDIMYSECDGGYELLINTYHEQGLGDDLLQVLWEVFNKLMNNEII